MDDIDVLIAPKPGWSVAKVLENYFAGWEKVIIGSSEVEFADSCRELVGFDEIACQTPPEWSILQPAPHAQETVCRCVL